MPRALHLTERYRSTFKRRAPARGSVAAKRLRATLNALAEYPLPGPQDYEILFPPVARYWCRRVRDANLWVAFVFDAEVVSVVALLTSPPVPLDTDE